MHRAAPLAFLPFVTLLAGCPSSVVSRPDGGTDAGVDAPVDAPADAPADALVDAPVDAPSDAPVDAPPPSDGGGIANPCALPGSVQFTANGTLVVPGNPSPVDLSFLHLPTGFCVHYYGTVGNARQIRQAPGGEIFVASPTQGTTGGGANGKNAVVVLPDDDHDGVADAPVTFLSGLPSTQGLMFANGHFYYQDGTKIMRVPYAAGDRKPSGPSEQVANIGVYTSPLHWPKPLDIADDGTIYVGNGGDQGESCDPSHPFHGGILALDGPAGGTQIAKGFRNPIALRCAKGHNRCFAVELAKDYTAGGGGREKVVPIHKNDDWGFPCCATQNLPYTDSPPGTDCSKIAPEKASVLIGDTPFGIAFDSGKWPGMWANRAYVTTHGAAGSWTGARLVAYAMDTSTGLLQPGTNINGMDTGGMVDFATGWDDGTLTHGRPAAVELSEDGRLFVSNDNNGVILWIAPLSP